MRKKRNTGNRQSCEFCLFTLTGIIYQLLLDVAALMQNFKGVLLSLLLFSFQKDLKTIICFLNYHLKYLILENK